jgi:hypothetical protein
MFIFNYIHTLYCKAIIAVYENKHSNQKMNEYIKVIGSLAKINSIVTKNITLGGMSVEKIKKRNAN